MLILFFKYFQKRFCYETLSKDIRYNIFKYINISHIILLYHIFFKPLETGPVSREVIIFFLNNSSTNPRN